MSCSVLKNLNESLINGFLPESVGFNLLVLGLTSLELCGFHLCGLCLGIELQNLVLGPAVFHLVISEFTYFLGDGKLTCLYECYKCVKVVAITHVEGVFVFSLGCLDVQQSLYHGFVTNSFLLCKFDRAHYAAVHNVDKGYDAQCKKSVDEFFHIGCFCLFSHRKNRTILRIYP